MTHADPTDTGPTYIVAGCKPWNRRIFDEQIRHYPGKWHFIDTPDALTPEWVKPLNPRYIFFLHWSWKVPDSIYQLYECVCFHMTDVPYGRGGSPLQNLLARGQSETQLTALRMVEAMDAGPVYLKRSLSLQGGSAEELYLRANALSAAMIQTLIETEPEPAPQEGEAVLFKRRKPEDSQIPHNLETLEAVYDFIRMLDADGYPKACLKLGKFTLQFSRAALYDGRVVADVDITPTV